MNKKVIAISLLSLLLLTACLALWYYFDGRVIDDNEGYKLKKEALVIPVYSNVKLSDLIEQIDGKLKKDISLDTTSLGEKNITFIYLNKDGKRRRGTFKVRVIDDEKPLIWLSDSYRVKVNSNDNLAKDIMCADNYDSKPSCVIEGEYNLSEPGAYKLSYVATDSSNNQSKVDFTLYVYEPEVNDSNETKPSSQTPFADVLNTYKTNENEVGIDVSKWQKEIDFQKVKQAGATFVMIRVGSQQGIEGKYVLDPMFERNVKEALKHGLKVGVYFYSYANSIKEAKKQARWVIKNIREYDVTLPVAFDWECYSSFNEMELSIFGLNEVASGFLEEVKKQSYDVMLYGSKNYLNAVWNYHDYDVWLAHYTKKTNYEGDHVMWQLCENGKIDGVEGMVDINVYYRKFKDS